MLDAFSIGKIVYCQRLLRYGSTLLYRHVLVSLDVSEQTVHYHIMLVNSK